MSNAPRPELVIDHVHAGWLRGHLRIGVDRRQLLASNLHDTPRQLVRAAIDVLEGRRSTVVWLEEPGCSVWLLEPWTDRMTLTIAPCAALRPPEGWRPDEGDDYTVACRAFGREVLAASERLATVLHPDPHLQERLVGATLPDMSDAVIAADGSCAIVATADETETAWASVQVWAEARLHERRDDLYAAASEFVVSAYVAAVPGIVDALLAAAETAANEEELVWLGTGPLEDLVSHTGNGELVLTEVDRAARQSQPFRTALAFTWVAADVPAPVRDRLGELGARLV